MGFTFCPLEVYGGWRRNQVSWGPSTHQAPHTYSVPGTADTWFPSGFLFWQHLCLLLAVPAFLFWEQYGCFLLPKALRMEYMNIMKFLPWRLLFLKACAPSEFWTGKNQLCNEMPCSLILLPMQSSRVSHRISSSLMAGFVVLSLPPASNIGWVCSPNVREDAPSTGVRVSGSQFLSIYSTLVCGKTGDGMDFREGLGSCLLKHLLGD